MGVYKKKNRWFIDYYLPSGKRKRESVTIPGLNPKHINRQDALKALSIRKGQIAEGKFNIAQIDKPILFEKLVDRYLEWAKNNHKVPGRDISASKALLSFFKGKDVNSINLWHVEKYKSERKAQNRKPATINKELGILKRMFNLALSRTFEGIKIISNPVKGIKLLRVPSFLPRTLKEDEFIKIYQSASSHFKPILLCAFTTGMRKGEIIKLKWENLDIKERYIYVIETKNNESRSIPISDILFETLLNIKKGSTSEYVFTTHEGKPYLSNSAWKRAWNTAFKKSGLEKCRFHDLRHSFVSNLIVGEKEDYATVMSISGHKDLRMLQRYSHTREEAKKSAISKLGNRLKSMHSEGGLDTYLDKIPSDKGSRGTKVIALSPGN